MKAVYKEDEITTEEYNNVYRIIIMYGVSDFCRIEFMKFTHNNPVEERNKSFENICRELGVKYREEN